MTVLTESSERVPVRIASAPLKLENGTMPQRSFKVAMAQITTYPGQIKHNTEKIIDAIEKAKASGSDLVVFPELAIPGYAAMDLFFRKDYLEENLLALEAIREASKGIAIVIGFVDVDYSKQRPGQRPTLYNSAAIIDNGNILHIQDKSLYPNYDIFFEDRYFAPPRDKKVVEIRGVKVGVQICEDLWSQDYPVNPTKDLADNGAELIINISASPFHIGKVPARAKLISEASKNNHVPLIYTNLVGAFDGYEGDVVFDGRSMAYAANGDLAAFSREFAEEILVVDALNLKSITLPKIDPVAEMHDALVLGIREYFQRLALASDGKAPSLAILGLSGGIDSAVVAALAAEALGSDNVLGITMPSRYSSGETISDAQIVADNLGIRFLTASIENEFKTCVAEAKTDPLVAAKPEDVSEQNIQARLRMMKLMFYANKFGGIVLNTGNKTELALNNCTIYGDMVGGFSVLGDLDKDRIYALATEINQRAQREVIPLSTIERVPSAELAPNQSDDQVMGAHPAIIAPLVRGIIENNYSVEEAIAEFGDRFNQALIRDTYKKLDRSEWKRRQSSPGIRVTPHAFGNGRKIPISHGYDEVAHFKPSNESSASKAAA